jgi:ribosomal protein L23
MKTYTGTVVCKLYREVIIEVEDDASKDNIEYAMAEYFHSHNLKPEDMDTEVWDIEEVK